MKNFTSLTMLLILNFIIHNKATAQWTIDPANPAVVCDAVNRQIDVLTIADGEGGLYTFWMDSRLGTFWDVWDLWGQHYNADGEAQWEANGREIINYDGRVSSYTAMLEDDGTIMLAWTITHSTNTAENGAYFRRMNSDAENVWEEDIQLRDEAGHTNAIGSIRMVKSLNSYFIATQTIYLGQGYIRVNKMDENGTFLWPYGGSLGPGMSGGYGSFKITGDDFDGFYILKSSGNGVGAWLYCRRFSGNSDINSSWTDWVTVTAGTAGLGYMYDGIGDPLGITIVWQGTGEPTGSGSNLYSRRLLATTGAMDWNGTTLSVSAEVGPQYSFYWKKRGNQYYITWIDGRAGTNMNYIYSQKFDTAGNISYTEGGIQVGSVLTNVNHFDLDEDNNMCVLAAWSTGLNAHKLNADGTVQWQNGLIVLTQSFANFDSFDMVATGGKFIVVNAVTTVSAFGNNVYMNKVQVPQVQISEVVTACNSYTTHGETFISSGNYTIEFHPDTVLTLDLTIINSLAEVGLSGTTLTSVNNGSYQWYDCATNQPIAGATQSSYTPTQTGAYSLQLTAGICVDMSDCIEVTIVSVENVNGDSFIFIYPNPSEDVLNINLNKLNFVPQQLEIYNALGQIIYSERILNKGQLAINTSSLSSGTYIVQLKDGNASIKTHWIKK